MITDTMRRRALDVLAADGFSLADRLELVNTSVGADTKQSDLRDEFAKCAMGELLATPDFVDAAAQFTRGTEMNLNEVVATRAYDMADAMMAERAKRLEGAA